MKPFGLGQANELEHHFVCPGLPASVTKLIFSSFVLLQFVQIASLSFQLPHQSLARRVDSPLRSPIPRD